MGNQVTVYKGRTLGEKLAPAKTDESMQLALNGSGTGLAWELFRIGALRNKEKIEADLAKRKKSIAWTSAQITEFRSAMLEAAGHGYTPGKDAYIVPFWDQDLKLYEMKLLHSYHGIIERLGSRGCTIHPPQLVHAGDTFQEKRELVVIDGKLVFAQTFLHEVNDHAKRGEPVGAYVVWEQDGVIEFEYKTAQYFAKVKEFAEKKKKGAWSGPFGTQKWRTQLVSNTVPKWARFGLPVLSGEGYDNEDETQRDAAPEGAIDVDSAEVSADVQEIDDAKLLQQADAAKEAETQTVDAHATDAQVTDGTKHREEAAREAAGTPTGPVQRRPLDKELKAEEQAPKTVASPKVEEMPCPFAD